MRILVVEDEAIVARDIQETLISQGYEVPAIASSAEEAIEQATRLRPDLVLMDIVLKGRTDGITAADRIRRDLRIPIIFLTAYSDDAILEKAKATGPAGYIIKPFQERELHTTIEMALYKHKIERRLEEGREWLSVILRSIADAVIATDRDGRITFMNPAAEALTGWARQDAMRKPILTVARIIHGSTGQPITSLDELQRKRARDQLESETLLLARQGARHPVEFRIASIRGERGGELGKVLILRDITEQRQLLLREQLAKQEAQEANHAKDLFIANLSHELRTPLTPLLAWSQMLKTGKLSPDKIQAGADMFERSVRALRQLVDDLLDVSRIILGKMTLDLQSVDLPQIAESAVSLVRSAAESKRIAIRVEAESDVRAIEGDPIRLQQVFWNLLVNAVKFTPDGGRISVSVRNSSFADGTETVVFEVSDTGRGIPPEFLSRIFDRFTQADSSSTRTHRGLGLGLSIVRNLVEMHGGTVQAESPGSGKGSTFRVIFPTVKRIKIKNIA